MGFTVSTLDSANRDRGVGVDTLTEEEKNELHKAEEQIRRRVQRGGRINRYQPDAYAPGVLRKSERYSAASVSDDACRLLAFCGMPPSLWMGCGRPIAWECFFLVCSWEPTL